MREYVCHARGRSRYNRGRDQRSHQPTVLSDSDLFSSSRRFAGRILLFSVRPFILIIQILDRSVPPFLHTATIAATYTVRLGGDSRGLDPPQHLLQLKKG